MVSQADSEAAHGVIRKGARNINANVTSCRMPSCRRGTSLWRVRHIQLLWYKLVADLLPAGRLLHLVHYLPRAEYWRVPLAYSPPAHTWISSGGLERQAWAPARDMATAAEAAYSADARAPPTVAVEDSVREAAAHLHTHAYELVCAHAYAARTQGLVCTHK